MPISAVRYWVSLTIADSKYTYIFLKRFLKIALIDDHIGLSAFGSVRQRTAFLWL